MSWWLLALAIVLEVCGTTSMKLSDGFSKVAPSVCVFVFYAAAFTSLTFALKRIELGIAYAIWSGVGTVLIAVVATFWFQEGMTLVKALSIALVILGVIGLKVSSAT